jgi:hypothetical protein
MDCSLTETMQLSGGRHLKQVAIGFITDVSVHTRYSHGNMIDLRYWRLPSHIEVLPSQVRISLVITTCADHESLRPILRQSKTLPTWLSQSARQSSTENDSAKGVM